MMKKLLSILMVMALVVSFGTIPSYAAENNTTVTISDYLTDEGISFMEKLALVYDSFVFDDDGKLTISAGYSEIQQRAGFTESEMDIFRDMLVYANDNISDGNIQLPESNTRMFVSDWKVYFTYDEVMSLFFAAASIGPAALTAAISALATTVSPGIGTILGAVVGFVVSADMCYLVLRAAANYKGIYIGFSWDGILPYYDQGTW